MRQTFEVRRVGNRRGEIELEAPPLMVTHEVVLVCSRCRKNDAKQGRKSCEACLDYDRVKAAIWRMDAREKNGCLVCKKPVKAGTHKVKGKEVPFHYCEGHLAYYRFHTRRG